MEEGENVVVETGSDSLLRALQAVQNAEHFCDGIWSYPRRPSVPDCNSMRKKAPSGRARVHRAKRLSLLKRPTSQKGNQELQSDTSKVLPCTRRIRERLNRSSKNVGRSYSSSPGPSLALCLKDISTSNSVTLAQLAYERKIVPPKAPWVAKIRESQAVLRDARHADLACRGSTPSERIGRSYSPHAGNMSPRTLNRSKPSRLQGRYANTEPPVVSSSSLQTTDTTGPAQERGLSSKTLHFHTVVKDSRVTKKGSKSNKNRRKRKNAKKKWKRPLPTVFELLKVRIKFKQTPEEAFDILLSKELTNEQWVDNVYESINLRAGEETPAEGLLSDKLDSTLEWETISVLCYDEENEKYQVRVHDPASKNGRIRWLRRLNIRFRGESRDSFAYRKSTVLKRHAEAMRVRCYQCFINSQTVRSFGNPKLLPYSWGHSIAGVIAKHAPSSICGPQSVSQFVENLKDEVTDGFYGSMKRAKADYFVLKKAIDAEMYRVPFWSSSSRPVLVPPHWSKKLSIKSLQEKHIFTIPKFVDLLLKLKQRWAQLDRFSFVDVGIGSSFEIPLTVRRLQIAQRLNFVDTQSFLRNEWYQFSVSRVESFLDGLKGVDLGAKRKVLTLINLQMSYQLCSLVQLDIRKWESMVCQFTCRRDEVESKYFNLPPLFRVGMMAENDILFFQPGLKEIEDTLLAVPNRILSNVDEFTMLEGSLNPDRKSRHLYSPGARMSIIRPRYTNDTQDLISSLANRLAIALKVPNELLERFRQRANFLLSLNPAKYAKSIIESAKLDIKQKLDGEKNGDDIQSNQSSTGALYRNAIQKLIALREAVQEISGDIEVYPLVQIDCTVVKKYLVQKAQQTIAHLLKEISSEVRHALRHANKIFSSILSELKDPPSKACQLQGKREFIFRLEKHILKVQEEYVNPSNERVALLNSFGFAQSRSDFVLFANMRIWPQKLRRASEMARRMILSRQKIFERELFKEQNSFEGRLLRFRGEVGNFVNLGDLQNVGQSIMEVETLQRKLEAALGTVRDFNEREELFRREITEYKSLKLLMADFEPYAILWRVAADWAELEQDWYHGSFAAIDPTVLPGGFGGLLTPFQRLILVKTVRPDRCLAAIQNFVRDSLGPHYLDPPAPDLAICLAASSPIIPLLLITSPGTEALVNVLKLARKQGYGTKWTRISLGQGQGPIAAAAISTAVDTGRWVILENCHLSPSWMPTFERIVDGIDIDYANEDFRLWLTTMPSSDIPVMILQRSIKVTIEVPRGLRGTLLRSFSHINKEWFEDAAGANNDVFKKMFFSLCFFHAVIKERKRFGAVGWNVAYQWNDSDLSISMQQLESLVKHASPGTAPLTALLHMTGELNYGGRTTDEWDLRTLKTILRDFYCDKVFNFLQNWHGPYRFSRAKAYYIPPVETFEEYVEYITSLPLNESAEVFGLHKSVYIASARKDAQRFLDRAGELLRSRVFPAPIHRAIEGPKLINAQQRRGREVGISGECINGSRNRYNPQYDNRSSHDDQTQQHLNTSGMKVDGDEVITIIQSIIGNLPGTPNCEQVAKQYPPSYDQCMNNVLVQEVHAFSRLEETVRNSLLNVQNALDGIIIMSESYENLANDIQNNRVPSHWNDVAYPSTKSLPQWVEDFGNRVKFLGEWIELGLPSSFWISAFFFTHAFLTSVKQNFARKHTIAIDQVIFSFEVNPQKYLTRSGAVAPPEGQIIHGLFLEGARWKSRARVLGEIVGVNSISPFPPIWLIPRAQHHDKLVNDNNGTRGGTDRAIAGEENGGDKAKDKMEAGSTREQGTSDSRKMVSFLGKSPLELRNSKSLSSTTRRCMDGNQSMTGSGSSKDVEVGREGGTEVFECPLYKTCDREGQLSTTGHSTNFVLAVMLPRKADQSNEHWIKRGVALLCSTSDCI